MRIWLVTAVLCGFRAPTAFATSASSFWEQPAAALADQIAAILGPGEARLTVRNLSSIPADEIPTIRALLEADLKSHGITVSGPDSANSIRVTLSESTRARLWVAELVEGSETRFAMVDLRPNQPVPAGAAGEKMTLRKQQILSSRDAVLAALEVPDGLIALEPKRIVRYTRLTDGSHVEKQASVPEWGQLSRDPRGMLAADPDGMGFTAWLPGRQCAGQFSANSSATDWPVQCTQGDDPWPLVQSATSHGFGAQGNPPASAVAGAGSIKAFYNQSRNYFTGVVAPAIGVDLPPFYSAALIARLAGTESLLIGGIDGKIQLVENGALHNLAGARDWGSDFAVLRSGCGAGEQVIASGSGEAAHDSLRAYEIPAFEAIPASEALAVDGTVTALWSAPNGESVIAVVRNGAEQYEVDRVTAFCN